MFWGTDWTRLPCPWRQAVTLFTEELTWFSNRHKERIMGKGHLRTARLAHAPVGLSRPGSTGLRPD
jgi:hypothetical protein